MTQFLDVLERSAKVTVRSISAQHEAEALTWLRQHDEREYSFVDATSFVTMRRLRIKSGTGVRRWFQRSYYS